MREVILDTETTGLDPKNGHRITEIGCVELIDHVPTGSVYQVYINPERDVPKEAEAICGLPTEFFFDKPKFHEIVDDFLAFIDNDKLVIHNATFDIKFLNMELGNIGRALLSIENTVDTLMLARKMFPGAPASLDALCKRFNVDLSVRAKHGALLDCQLLAEVYINLLGGKQSSLLFERMPVGYLGQATANQREHTVHNNGRTVRVRKANVRNDELSAHNVLVNSLKDPIWKRRS